MAYAFHADISYGWEQISHSELTAAHFPEPLLGADDAPFHEPDPHISAQILRLVGFAVVIKSPRLRLRACADQRRAYQSQRRTGIAERKID